MKITICAYDRPLHYATGPNTWLQRIIPFLLEKEIAVQLLILYSGDLNLCPTINFFKETDVSLELLDKPLFEYVEEQVKWILKKTRIFQPNVFFCNLVVPAFYCSKQIKKAGIPVLGMIHSNDTFYQDVISKFVIQKSDYQFDHTVVVSKMLEKQLIDNKVNPASIHRIPYGTKLPNKLAEYDNFKLKIIYLGRLEIEQKQILTVVEAFCYLAKSHTNIEFSIYGSGSEEEEISTLISKYDVQNKVFLKGAIRQEEVYEILSEHHIFTLLSDYEGLPVALQEAMACGLVPVCLYEESGISELITHGENGFIVKNREEDYYKYIEKFINNKELWEELSRNARKTIVVDYNMNSSFEFWHNLLFSIASKNLRAIKIPFLFNIKMFSPLPYGENRKPGIKYRIKKQFSHNWLAFKMAVRPRARLRSVFKK